MSITRKGYYSNANVLFNMIEQHMGGRETFFLDLPRDENGAIIHRQPIRWLMANYIGMLQKHWAQYGFLDKSMNLYFSLAKYKDLPMFSYTWRIKSQEQNIWMDAFKDRVMSYDCFIETDHHDVMFAMADMKDIKTFLDKYKQKYSLSFSGSKGAHAIIPSEEFNWLPWKTFDAESEQRVQDEIGGFDKTLRMLPCPLSGEIGNKIFLDKVTLYKILALRLKTMLSCSTLDTSVQDVKRVSKTKYSWDCKSNHIALPLDDSQFYNFKRDICLPENVIKINLFKRGLLYRNTDFTTDFRASLCKEMLIDLGILRKA